MHALMDYYAFVCIDGMEVIVSIYVRHDACVHTKLHASHFYAYAPKYVAHICSKRSRGTNILKRDENKRKNVTEIRAQLHSDRCIRLFI